MKITSASSRPWQTASLFGLLGIFVLSLWDIATNTHFGEQDFMAYWSSTYLFNRGENPYSPQLMAEVQQAVVRSTLDVTIMSWNPPILFVFLLPLAWMPFVVAKFVWLLVSVSLLLTAGLMLTRIYMTETSRLAKLTFLAFAIGFPAVIAGLYMGQVTFLVFWAVVCCLTLIRKEQWFWAGAVLIFTAIKPHLTILSVIYLLFSMARHRRWQGWLGLALSATACLIILLHFRPALIHDLQGETAVASVRWATSTIGGLLSYLQISEAARYMIVLLLPLPLLLAKYPDVFGMELSIALLTLLTVPTTFFGWSYDQTILLIPIAQVFGWLPRSKFRLPVLVCIVCALVINYLQRLLVINDTYYLWVPLFWWIIFGTVWRDIAKRDNSHVYSNISSFPDHSFKKRI